MFSILSLILMGMWFGTAVAYYVTNTPIPRISYLLAVLAWCVAVSPYLKPLFN